MAEIIGRATPLLSVLVVFGLMGRTGLSQDSTPLSGQSSPAVAEDLSNSDSGADTELIKKLERYLSGTRWRGQFTITGKDLNELTPEYYEITKAVKTPHEDYWMLTVRIKYGDHDSTLDLPPIQIKWAGETPVITVDQVSIPGFGTFDARVVIRKNKYAGTWSHNAVGGHLFGTIERITPRSKEKKSEESRPGN